MRASGSDDSVRIIPKKQMTLEECMEYIQQDECIEVTPKKIRMRKVILNEDERKRTQKQMKSEEVRCTRTAQQLGERPAKALNRGIIMLAFTPLAIFGVIGYRWWKSEQGHD
jgi:hypothetical protein